MKYTQKPKKAIFLDRDGVLIKDNYPVTSEQDIHFFSDSIPFLKYVNSKDYIVLVITNQTVISRGLISENELESLHVSINEKIMKSGGPTIEKYYYCPHHPNANLETYRKICKCRKPQPGLLFEASIEYNLNLEKSIFIGDRLTDIMAGNLAGCQTILLETGGHDEDLIEFPITSDMNPVPVAKFKNLTEVIGYIEEKNGL